MHKTLLLFYCLFFAVCGCTQLQSNDSGTDLPNSIADNQVREISCELIRRAKFQPADKRLIRTSVGSWTSGWLKLQTVYGYHWIDAEEMKILRERGYTTICIRAETDTSFRVDFINEYAHKSNFSWVMDTRSLPPGYLKMKTGSSIGKVTLQ